MTDLLLDVLAAARITRLVVEDDITSGPRRALIRFAYARAGRPLDDAEDPEHAVLVDTADPPKVARLITCPWCVGVYVAGAVVLVRGSRAWRPLRDVLALSMAQGWVLTH